MNYSQTNKLKNKAIKLGMIKWLQVLDLLEQHKWKTISFGIIILIYL